MGRRLTVLLAPVAAGLVIGFRPGRVVWALLGFAIVGLELVGRVARREQELPMGTPLQRRRWRRQLRRRRIINRRRRIHAQRAQARAVREAKERRRGRRRLRRRRRIQARGGWGPPRVPVDRTDRAAPPAVVEIDLTDRARAGPAVEIDLAEAAGSEAPNELDLTDRTIYDSEITLESGDTLESGVIGPCIELWPASDRLPHD